MTENTLITMEGFVLPPDLPWRSGFVNLVHEQLRHLHVVGKFKPPRFFGYYFKDGVPICVAGGWTILLDENEDMKRILRVLKVYTLDKYSVECDGDGMPAFILIHDRRPPGVCWLWCYEVGVHFVSTNRPVFD